MGGVVEPIIYNFSIMMVRTTDAFILILRLAPTSGIGAGANTFTTLAPTTHMSTLRLVKKVIHSQPLLLSGPLLQTLELGPLRSFEAAIDSPL